MASELVDLSCDFKKHGVLVRPGVLEVKCSSRFCGARPGAVVLHRFDTTTGQLLETVRYKTPKGLTDGTHDHPAALRLA